MFAMPLNFSQKEIFTVVGVTFDYSKVNQKIKIEDFKVNMLKKACGKQVENKYEEFEEPEYNAIPDHDVE